MLMVIVFVSDKTEYGEYLPLKKHHFILINSRKDTM